MFRKILHESIQELLENTKLIRLAFIVTFCHSLASFYLIAWNANNMLNYKFHTGTGTFEIIGQIIQWAIEKNIILRLIIWIVIIVIGYGILYPIGQSALIHYLHDKKKSIGTALGKGTNDFFIMFEFDALTMSFGLFTFITTVSRLYMLDILDNVFFMTLTVIWFIAVILAAILWPYMKYIIVLWDKEHKVAKDEKGIFSSMKKSIELALTNFSTTVKFALLETLLLARFIVNIIIIVWVPVLIIYIASLFGFQENPYFLTIIYILAGILIILTAYINAIIEALFTTYRFKLYHHITKHDE